MRIYDVMTTDVVAVHPDTPLKEVARLLTEHRIGGMPVVDAENVVIGVISESDFVIKERGADYLPDSIVDRLTGRTARDARRVAATTAGEAMTAPAVTIEGRIASVREAAITMLDHRINRIPITEHGRLVGIITRGDLVRLYARPDEQIAEHLRDVLRAVDGLVVERVEDGVVTLAGTVASTSLADAAVRLAESIEGVVGVERDELSARAEEDAYPPMVPS